MILFSQYTLTAAAASLDSAAIFNVGPATTNAAPVTKVRQLIIRNNTGAANPIYLGPSTVTNVPAFAGIQLAAGESLILNAPGGSFIDLRQMFIVGTVAGANIAYLTAIFG